MAEFCGWFFNIRFKLCEQCFELKVLVLVSTSKLARLVKKAAILFVASMFWSCPSHFCVFKKTEDDSGKFKILRDG